MHTQETKAINYELGVITVSFNTIIGNNHELIWEHKELVTKDFINELTTYLTKKTDFKIKIELITYEKGCFKAKLKIFAWVVGTTLASVELYETDTVKDIIEFAIDRFESNLGDTDTKCHATLINNSMNSLCYGPIKKGETLFTISERLASSNYNKSTAQLMIALYMHNPMSFYGESINNLKEGSYLFLSPSPKYLSRADAEIKVNSFM